MAEALTLTPADARLAALAGTLLLAPAPALSRLGVPAAEPLTAEAVRLAAAPRRERLLALHQACAAVRPVPASLDAALAGERGGLASLLREAARSRPGARGGPLLRLCLERLSRQGSLP